MLSLNARFRIAWNKQSKAHTLYFSQPVWLVVVLRRDSKSVEEHQDDDEPIKGHRFHSCATLPAAETVPSTPLTAEGDQCHMFRFLLFVLLFIGLFDW